MKVALICFSLTGQQTGERLCRGLEAAGMTAELDKESKYLLDSIRSVPLHGQERNFLIQMH